MSGKIESNLTKEKGNLVVMICKRFVNLLIRIFSYYWVVLVNCFPLMTSL